MELIIYLLIGAMAGFAAGLFGVGGGMIIVPILYIVFTQLNYDPAVIMHLAVGTSLATIIVTSISSVSAHHKRGAVLWDVFANLAPGLALGSFLGAGIADYISGQGLQLLIGFFAVWVAYGMFNGASKPVDLSKHLPSKKLQLLAGGGIGIASAIFGIGGGSLTVPFLNWAGLPMKQAVGTSAACGLPIALAGAAGFAWFGQDVVNLPEGTIGFVHITAFLFISVASFAMAKVGAKLAHVLPALTLKRAFGVLLLFAGGQLLLSGIGVI